MRDVEVGRIVNWLSLLGKQLLGRSMKAMRFLARHSSDSLLTTPAPVISKEPKARKDLRICRAAEMERCFALLSMTTPSGLSASR
jgi:hypothetical protein